MNASYTIIDVTPVEHSSTRGASGDFGRAQAHASSQSAKHQQPTWRAASSFHGDARNAEQVHYGSAYTRFGDQTVTMKSAGSMLGGLVQVAVGAGLVLIGIPMLILPGPGLLSIVGGMALAGYGMRKLLG